MTQAVQTVQIERWGQERSLLAAEEALQAIEGGRSTDSSNRFGQGNLFRASFHAVLGVAAVVYTPHAQDLFHSVVLEDFACGVFIEQQGLVDGMRS